jgi:hypothetical protein
MPKPRDEDDKRQSFPTTNLQDIDMLDESRSFYIAEVQPTSTSDLPERRSFPTLEMSDGDVEDGRYSFPTPKLRHIDMSRCR